MTDRLKELKKGVAAPEEIAFDIDEENYGETVLVQNILLGTH